MTEHEGHTKECPFCLSAVPAEASRCRHCTSELANPVQASDVTAFWGSGVLLTLVGAGLTAGGDQTAWAGIPALIVGGVLLQIAVIARAVSLGLRDRDERAWKRRLDNAARAADVTT